MTMKLLSIALTWHDGNLSFFDGEKVRYHKLERSTQIKRYHSESFWDWQKDIKNLWGIDYREIDDIVIIFDTYEKFKDWEDYDDSIKKVVEGVDNSVLLENEINPLKNFGVDKVHYIGHHYAHSLCTWMLQERESDVCFVFDGAGERKSWSVFKNHKLIDRGHIDFGSIGWGIREAGKFLGIKYSHRNDIAGKLMGLQSYGNLDLKYLEHLNQYNIEHIKDIFHIDDWIEYKGDPLVAQLTALDWIRTVHYRIGQLLVDFFKKYADENSLISYTGGVAQNVIWNTELKKTFKNLVIPPHSSDEGLSLGGIEFLRKKHKLPKFNIENFPYCQSDNKPNSTPSIETIKFAADLLSQGKKIGWYQGEGEVGPRALGNRSILMDPRIPNGKEIINRIKKRENYRPFGASILKEFVSDYFDLEWEDPFMLYTTKVKVDGFSSITHIDNTCRIQTVDNSNTIFRSLLEEFYRLTGCPILLNTSLNLAGKPLAGYPENAKELLFQTELDFVFIGNEIYTK